MSARSRPSCRSWRRRRDRRAKASRDGAKVRRGFRSAADPVGEQCGTPRASLHTLAVLEPSGSAATTVTRHHSPRAWRALVEARSAAFRSRRRVGLRPAGDPDIASGSHYGPLTVTPPYPDWSSPDRRRRPATAAAVRPRRDFLGIARRRLANRRNSSAASDRSSTCSRPKTDRACRSR